MITSLVWYSRPQERQRNRPPECEVTVALSTYTPRSNEQNRHNEFSRHEFTAASYVLER